MLTRFVLVALSLATVLSVSTSSACADKPPSEQGNVGADKSALFGRVYQRAVRAVQACEAQLEHSFGVDVGLDTFTKLAWTEAWQRVQLCRDSNNVALAAPGKPMVILCAPQFWQLAEREPDQAAAFLVHEYLHTRGLREWPQAGARIDSVGITREIRSACPAPQEAVAAAR